MKKLITMTIMVLAVAVAMAQAPEKFTYQAVVRNASNALVTDAQVGVRVSILQGGASGNAVYVETHTATTNINGLLTIEIGGGTVQQGVFANIDWANGPYFLKTETDPVGGSNYSITSVQQLLSVPYALYAKDAGNIPTVPVNVSAFTNDAGYITAQDIPEIPTVPTNVSAFVNDVPYMTSFTEQQILTISNDTIFLTGGSFVKLPEGFNGDYNSLTNTPSIPTVPTNVSAFVNDMGYLTSFTEQQVLSISNDTIFLTGGSFVKLPAGFDGDYNNLTNTPTIPTVPSDVSVFNNDANYVSNTECADVDLCALAALVSSLQGQLTELQGQLAELQSTIDSLTVPDTTVTPIDTATLPTVITGAVSNITETTATCGGEVTADGGAAVTERGVCWSTSATPTVADNHTSDGAGLGTFTSNITGLTANTTYYVRAYATNSVGTFYGETVTFTTEASTPVVHGQPCPGTPTVTDHEGNVYATVQIGNQCWMRDNLRTTTSPSTGTYLIPTADASYTYTGKQARWYNNDSATYAPMNYGLLYNWNAAVDTFNTAYGETSVSTNGNNSVSVSFTGNRRGICPSGWHLPSDAEWTQLTDYVSNQSEYTCGGNSSYIAKALASETGWNSHTNTCAVGNDPSANNAMGFSAVPAGYCSGSSFYNAGYYANFCSSSQYPNNRAWTRTLNYNSANVLRSYNTKYNGYSVRCLRDEGGTDTTQATLPTVITGAVSGITETTASCGGEVTADGGVAVTERGVCWSTSATPTVADNHTSDGAGLGTFTSSITGLTANTTYYVRAYAINSVGTAYGEMVTFTTEASTPVVHGQPCPGTPTVTDYDGNIYNTVQIGTQCWTKENLRTTHYADGTAIPAGGYNTSSFTDPYYYDNSSHSLPLAQRGYLYNWPAAMHGAASSSANPSGVQGICPAGWHLPSDAEWTQLTDYVKTQSDYVCGGNTDYIAKALASMTGWLNDEYCDDSCDVGYDPSTNNASGFGTVPAGDWDGDFFGEGYAFFWSSAGIEGGSFDAYYRYLYNYDPYVYRLHCVKYVGFSVRCLRNEGGTDTTQTTLPTVITGAVSDITETTANCGGEVTADGGAAVTERGVCWSTSATPTVADAHTSEGTGTGTFTSSITGLTANTTYYVRAYATNSEGTGYGEQKTFITETAGPVIDEKSCPAAPTVTDHEGNVYATVLIGNQCWMRDNLRTTTSPSTGTYLIPAVETYDTYTGKQARWYDNDSATYAPKNYGLFYNWNAAVDTFNTSYGETSVNTDYNNAVSVIFMGNRRGICPAGWHLPSDAEWTTLTDYVKTQSDYVCGDNSSYIAKALASTTGWLNDEYCDDPCDVGYDPSTNNTSGFGVVPAGHWDNESAYYAGYLADFWSSTESEYGSYGAKDRELAYNYPRVFESASVKIYSFSVRCLRDEGGTDTTQTTLPTVITGAVSNITETTATCGGEVTADGGAAVTERGVCWSTSATPTVADAHTSDGTGTGTFTSSITGLTANTTYYVRAYATNSVGTGYGEVVTFTTEAATPAGDGQPCPGAVTITDYDGNVYNTVQIGNQCWTRENLHTTHYADGTLIPAGGDDWDDASDTEPYYYDYSRSGILLAERGYHYNWSAAMHGASSSSAIPSGVQGVCPTGWHLPSDAEWTVLTDYVGANFACGGDSSYIAKALASTTWWESYSFECCPGDQSVTANNTTGFGAVPAGIWISAYDWAGYYAGFWSSTELDSYYANYRDMFCNSTNVGSGYSAMAGSKEDGLSVRCLRDSVGGGETSVTLPTVTTDMVSDITANTANCGGNVISDGGATVIVRGVCWSTYQYPTVGNNHTTDGSGMGIFNSSITGLSTNITYYVRAYATNSEGTAYGEVVTFTTEAAPPAGNGQPCPSTPTVTDYDGNVYNTVQIGDQCWTRENLRVTHYSDGMPIPAGGDNMSNTEPFYYDYSSSGIPLSDRGYLYNWPAAMHGAASSSAVSSWVQGVCPTGWHLPGDAEWTALGDYVGANYACGGETYKIAKALASTTGWNTSTTSCAPGNDQSTNNASGFGAVPAGYYSYGNNDWYGSTDYHCAGYNTTFWSPTEYDSYGAYGSTLNYNGVHVYRSGIYGKEDGFSVRCLRDEGGTDTTQTTLPTVITGAVSDITENTATCGGEVTADGGAAVTERGVCWSTLATPTVADAHTSDGTGTGTFTSSITGLTANTTYYVRAYATNSVGTGYGEVVTFTTEAATPAGGGQPCPGTPTVTDYDGNVYNTVLIGNQCWTKENLRTTHYADGTPIPAGGDNTSTTAPYYYDYSSSNIPLSDRGYLYNWPAAMHGAASSNAVPSGVQGVCPTGWHLPSDAEWNTMEATVSGSDWQTSYETDVSRGSHAGKLAGGDSWATSTISGAPGDYGNADRNVSGFSAVPAGVFGGSSFDDTGNSANFWSATRNGLRGAYHRTLYYNGADVIRVTYDHYSMLGYGFSVRCVRN